MIKIARLWDSWREKDTGGQEYLFKLSVPIEWVHPDSKYGETAWALVRIVKEFGNGKYMSNIFAWDYETGKQLSWVPITPERQTQDPDDQLRLLGYRVIMGQNHDYHKK